MIKEQWTLSHDKYLKDFVFGPECKDQKVINKEYVDSLEEKLKTLTARFNDLNEDISKIKGCSNCDSCAACGDGVWMARLLTREFKNERK